MEDAKKAELLKEAKARSRAISRRRQRTAAKFVAPILFVAVIVFAVIMNRPSGPLETNTGVSELGVSELGVSELGVSELGVSELGVSELGVSELGVSELGVSELGVSELGMNEFRHNTTAEPDPDAELAASVASVIEHELNFVPTSGKLVEAMSFEREGTAATLMVRVNGTMWGRIRDVQQRQAESFLRAWNESVYLKGYDTVAIDIRNQNNELLGTGLMLSGRPIVGLASRGETILSPEEKSARYIAEQERVEREEGLPHISMPDFVDPSFNEAIERVRRQQRRDKIENMMRGRFSE